MVWDRCRLTSQVRLSRGAREHGRSGKGLAMSTTHGVPEAQGLYDPAHEHDACGVGFVVDIKGRRSHAIVSQALQVLMNLLHRGACGCEVNTGRRRRHPHPDAGRVPRARVRPPRHRAARAGRLRRRPRLPAARRRDQRGDLPRHRRADRRARRARRVLGWRDVPTDDSPRRRRARARSEPVFEQVFIGRGAVAVPRPRRAFERKLYVIRKRVEHAVRSSRRSREREVLLHREPLAQHAHLQGHADGRPDRADVPGSGGSRLSSRRWRSCTSASAPTRSRRGRSRTRTATSRTTARSTRCAATSTGCARARALLPVARSSATTCRRSCRSSARAAATRRRSTTCSSSSSWPGRSLPHAILMMIPEPWSGPRDDGAGAARRSTSTTRR